MTNRILSPSVWNCLYWFIAGLISLGVMMYCFHENYSAIEATGKPVNLLVTNAVISSVICIVSIIKVTSILLNPENWK